MNIEKTLKALKNKGYIASYFERADEAGEYLDIKIDNKTVGFGDSATLSGLDLFPKLSAHNEVYDPQNCSAGMGFIATAKKCLATEIFITSVNALAATGEMVNIDGTGNRVAGALFGHEKVYFVAGINKLTPTLEDAIWRARNIAAPQNAMRLGLQTPCAVRGNRCYDCTSPDRICNGMVIHLRKMNDINMEIVLINEHLGL